MHEHEVFPALPLRLSGQGALAVGFIALVSGSLTLGSVYDNYGLAAGSLALLIVCWGALLMTLFVCMEQRIGPQ